jgi:hypothetical protein
MFLNEILFTDLLSHMTKPGLFRVRLSPERAKMLLQYNVKNRRQRKNLIVYLRRQISSDEWRDDHPQPIVFSDKKRLIDGQHRLEAIASSPPNTEVSVRVETGAMDSVREYMDTGVPRTLDDRVELCEDRNCNKFAAQIVNCAWEIRGGRAVGKATPDDAKDFFETHKSAILWAAATRKGDKGVGQMSVGLAAIEYYERNTELAGIFYADLFVAAGGVQQSQMLRDYLIRDSSGRSGSAATRLEFYQKSVSCMKAHSEGRIIKKVTRCSGWD